MPQCHPAALDPDLLLAQCRLQRTRRSGPGGQHRNKVQTAVCLTHLPTGIRAEASERRSGAENRGVALFRLRLSLALGVRLAPPPAPGPCWRAHCRDGRIGVNSRHADFPAVLAEALDMLAAVDFEPAAAAAALDCSSSQLLRLLRARPQALALVNAARSARGRRALR